MTHCTWRCGAQCGHAPRTARATLHCRNHGRSGEGGTRRTVVVLRPLGGMRACVLGWGACLRATRTTRRSGRKSRQLTGLGGQSGGGGGDDQGGIRRNSGRRPVAGACSCVELAPAPAGGAGRDAPRGRDSTLTQLWVFEWSQKSVVRTCGALLSTKGNHAKPHLRAR